MGAIAREINGGAVLDIEVRTIRTVAGRVHNVDLRVINRDDKRTRKARAAVIGGVGRAALDINVVAAVAAIPLKSVMLIVLNGESGGVLKVELVVAAEINCMRVVSCSRAVHSEGSAIERKGCALACAHGHPIPFGGVRSGANAGHARVNVLECQRLAPKSNALISELQRVAAAIDGEILAQVKAGSLRIGKQRNRLAVLCVGNSLIKRVVLGLANTCHSAIGIGTRHQNQRADKCHGKHRHQARCPGAYASFKLHFFLPIGVFQPSVPSGNSANDQRYSLRWYEVLKIILSGVAYGTHCGKGNVAGPLLAKKQAALTEYSWKLKTGYHPPQIHKNRSYAITHTSGLSPVTTPENVEQQSSNFR